MNRPFLVSVAIMTAIGFASFAAFWAYAEFSKTTPARRIAALQKEVQPKGGIVFETALPGKPTTFLVLDCAVYILDASKEGDVARTKVVRTGFYFGLDTCTDQSIKAEGEYIIVYLANRAIGAGGGNTSGGNYRSKDGVNWEKYVNKGWKPVVGGQ